ncbi:DNA processing protein DprA, putative [Pseudooceanicola batsensis HTCC2597]|uniref:DNA processing protein DprA, putative n=1 Tax=Pseudooceanicola batsensis (strain ATCC BAA-863 / DSM 15984 / KCTC 12145 / HTCC2597) TaxID=252305 RepID=A3TZ49_PSEBH|nr:DNA processing protein DprA, putative [Pseudooceanicola batsensis HTCC2597]
MLDLPETPAPEARDPAQTAALHREILDRLGPAPIAEDQLIRDLSRAARHVTPAITQLEMQGRVRRQAGGLLALDPGA